MSMKTVVLLFVNRNVAEINHPPEDVDGNRLHAPRENGGVAAKGALPLTCAEGVAGE
jgi:hypothetical protein